MKEKRIMELDIARGIAVLGMIMVHFIYDLQVFGGLRFTLPVFWRAVGDYGHILFIVISGICATFSENSFARGKNIFICGLLVSYITFYAELSPAFQNVRIYFGILHFLGASMMLYPAFRDFYPWELFILSIFLLGAGWKLERTPVKYPWLLPLGLRTKGVFPGSDYFPILPNLGYFLIGIFLGKTLYFKKQSVLPRIILENRAFQFLAAVGRNSLPVYLIHQPVLLGITFLLT